MESVEETSSRVNKFPTDDFFGSTTTGGGGGRGKIHHTPHVNPINTDNISIIYTLYIPQNQTPF